MKNLVYLIPVFLLWGSKTFSQTISLVKDINTNGPSLPQNFAVFDNKIYFFAGDNSHGSEPWVSDGTVSGTRMLKEVNESGGGYSIFRQVGGRLLFMGTTAAAGSELWVSDGTETGTVMLLDLFQGTDSGMPFLLDTLGGKLYFFATDAGGSALWATDGTETGTVVVKRGISVCCTSIFMNTVTVDGKLMFTAKDVANAFGDEVWITDGTESGTSLLKDINPGSPGSLDGNFYLHCFYELGNKVYFFAKDDTHGMELWESDGTAAGTRLLKDINPGAASGNISKNPRFYFYDGRLFFLANDGVHGTELWVTDGTVDGTMLLKDINPVGNSMENDNDLYGMAVLGDRLYFSANDGTKGKELWSTDGTEAGTVLVKDIAVNADEGSFPGNFIRMNDKLYFSAKENGTRNDLFYTDGTASGTQKISFEGYDGLPRSAFPFVYEDALFFKGYNNTSGFSFDDELFKMEEGGNSLVISESAAGPGMLYPNPTRSGFRVDLSISKTEAKEWKLLIYNSLGEIVLTRKVTADINSFWVDLPKVPGGIYQVVVTDGRTALKTEKIIVLQ